MSNINEKIKSLLAFYASFESFKADIETKLDKLDKPVDLNGLVKKDDLNKSIDILSEELKKAKFDAFAFDSARRTFGEEIGVLKSFIDKEIAKINASVKSSNGSDEIEFLASALSDLDKQITKVQSTIVKPKSYDAEIKALRLLIEKLPTVKNYDAEIKELKAAIAKMPAPKSYDKELAKIESSLSGFVGAEDVRRLISEIKKPKDFSADIEALNNKLKAIKLPADKSLEIEAISGRVKKLETVKHIDYSKDIEEVKKLIPKQIDNSKDVQELASQFKSALLEVNSKLSELASLSKKVDGNAFIADSARRTFGDEIGVLKSYIDKEFSKLKGGNNG